VKKWVFFFQKEKSMKKSLAPALRAGPAVAFAAAGTTIA